VVLKGCLDHAARCLSAKQLHSVLDLDETLVRSRTQHQLAEDIKELRAKM